MSSGISVLRRRMKNAAAGLALGFAAAMTLFPSTANAWWNDEWQLRKKINIDVSATGANITDPIGTTPTLVRLHIGNFRFSVAKDDGSDLRFVASDDKTPLKHHVEKWDSLLGEALVWVSLPNVAPGAKSEFWIYYGNKKAAATNDAKGIPTMPIRRWSITLTNAARRRSTRRSGPTTHRASASLLTVR